MLHQLADVRPQREWRCGTGRLARARGSWVSRFTLVLLDAMMPEHGRLRAGRASSSDRDLAGTDDHDAFTPATSRGWLAASSCECRRMSDETGQAAELLDAVIAVGAGLRHRAGRSALPRQRRGSGGHRAAHPAGRRQPRQPASWPSACSRSAGTRRRVADNGKEALDAMAERAV